MAIFSATFTGTADSCARARRVTTDSVQGIVQHGLTRGVVGGFGNAKRVFERAIFDIAVEYVVERRSGGGLGLLAHVRERPFPRAAEIAAIGGQLAADQGKQAAFAGSIAPGQADVPARMNEKTRAVQQKSGTPTQI